MTSSSELLAMVPCVLDFLDLDGFELLATASVSSDITIDPGILAGLLANASATTRDSGTVENTCISGKVTTNVHLNNILVSLDLNEDEFQQMFRMRQTTYLELLSALRQHEKMKENDDQILQNNVLMTLHFLGSQKNIQEICEMFHVNESDMLNSVKTTINSLYNLMPYFITWPNDRDKERIKEGFEIMCKLPSVVGVIDSTHIECKSGSHLNNAFYINANGKPTIILQAVCDHEMRFLHCCTGWPGSLDSSSILHDSDLCQDIVDKYSVYFPEDSHILGEKDYPLYKWLITPFEKLKTNLSDHELQFNFYHSLALDTISKAFLHLKRRFPRLACLDMVNLVHLIKTVLVSCALHNLCLNRNEYVLFADTNIDEHKCSNKASSREDDIIATEEGLLKRQELAKKFY